MNAEKFWARVPNRPSAPEECWLWAGAKLPKGYGTFCLGKGRRIYAHRAVWILTGSSLTSEEEIDHACRNPSCVRPGHLSVVPRGWNGDQGRMTQHLRVRTHCKRGHELTKENTYTQPSAWRPARLCRICANESKAKYAKKSAAVRAAHYQRNKEHLKKVSRLNYLRRRLKDLSKKRWA